MKTAEGRVAAFQFLLPAIHRITDKIERTAIAGDVAGYLGVESGLVLESFRKAAADRREKTVAAAPPEPVRHDEKILLKLFLNNDEARMRLIPELEALNAVEQFSTRRVFEALFALHAGAGAFGLAELDARLEEADRALLASIALDDATGDENLTLDMGMACLEKLQRRALDARIAAIKASIKNAERAGDMTGALRLYKDLQQFEQSQRAGGVQ
jgi:DNA primase